ncbi:hypothetical protein SUGI_1512440 [Cryptomeria japonica]|uniref:Uncharacterized protein n=1 Tax=Cryptomeria japonica TaxID=3369 RepID=A0AAD3NTC7_CRYJA|nr:hypothetical protein SUGI_1512440 [Cryptomeria japonica]
MERILGLEVGVIHWHLKALPPSSGSTTGNNYLINRRAVSNPVALLYLRAPEPIYEDLPGERRYGPYLLLRRSIRCHTPWLLPVQRAVCFVNVYGCR